MSDSRQTTAGRLADALEYLDAARQNVRELREQLRKAYGEIEKMRNFIEDTGNASAFREWCNCD